MFRKLLIAALASTRAVTAQNATATARGAAPTITLTEPCAQVSALAAYGVELIPANRAMACLKSVPLDKQGDLLQIKGLKTMLVMQSDLNYLKDPPPGYLYPGVDIMGSLDKIAAALEADEYDNEYDLQADILALIYSAYDFHLTYNADIIQAFTWGRAYSLISLSTDGVALPEIFVTSDILQELNSSSYNASPVTRIDGVDVEQWLNEEAALNPWDHDPDVNYNNQLYNVPDIAFTEQSFMNLFQLPYRVYPGEYTLISFANGTTRNTSNYATANVDFTGVTDGQSFFKKFCSPQQPTYVSSIAASATLSLAPSVIASVSSAAPTSENAYTPVPTTQRVPGPSYYPSPVVLAADGSIGGFFPDENEDLAVVTVPNFGPVSDYEFQNTFRTFLATAKAAGKTKLLIDLRDNGGGTVLDGYDLFKQLFPSTVPYGLQDLAASPLLDVLGQVASRLIGDDALEPSELGALDALDFRLELTRALKSFGSWSNFFGPVVRDGANFTQPVRYNLSDPDSLGAPIYGYINDTRPQPQTFDASNIVMLSDGACGSTCAIFAEFMKSQAGVQAIAVGGRKQYGPMQWVGGTKGSNDQAISDIAEQALELSGDANADEQKLFQPWVEDGAFEAVNQTIMRLGPDPSTGSNVNWKNNYRQGDSSFTPLQYVYEAADCRFFYTPAMAVKQSLVWQRAYDIRWGNGSCVAGSTGHPSSLSGAAGNQTDYIEACPPVGANNTFGANETFGYPGAAATKPPCVPVSGQDSASSGEGEQSPSANVAAGNMPTLACLAGIALVFTSLGLF